MRNEDDHVLADQQNDIERRQDLQESRRAREQVNRAHQELLARLRALDLIADVAGQSQ